HYIIKLIIRLIVMVGIIWLFIYFIAIPDNFIQQLLAEALTHGEHLQEYMTSINETYGGSGYTLPSLDLNAGGIIQTFFLSLNVTLFRPYVWECKNLLMVMSCIESFATLVLILIVRFKAGIIKIISYCNKFPV